MISYFLCRILVFFNSYYYCYLAWKKQQHSLNLPFLTEFGRSFKIGLYRKNGKFSAKVGGAFNEEIVLNRGGGGRLGLLIFWSYYVNLDECPSVEFISFALLNSLIILTEELTTFTKEILYGKLHFFCSDFIKLV